MSGYEWTVSGSPKTARLTGVESYGGVAFASGDRGLLLERVAPGEWKRLFSEGPTGDGHNILDLAITDDGTRVWYSGDSGSFGYYDREAGAVRSHQGPDDYTSGFASVTVDGPAGSERVHVTNNSGRVITATVDGRELAVESAVLPGDCTSFTEIVEVDGELFVAGVDGGLYHSTDGVGWERERLAKTRVEALAVAEDGVAAVTDDGTLYRGVSLFERESRTKQHDPGIAAPEEIAASGGTFAAVGRDGALVVVGPDGEVARPDPCPGVTLYGAEIMADGTVLAVGSGGTIVEGVKAPP